MPATWTGLVTSVSTVLSFRRARTRRRISALIHDSRRLYAEKQHEESLAKAVKAKDTAAELGTATRWYRDALFHVAATLAAMRRHTEALALLNESSQLVRAAFGNDSLKLIPILHATAEVLEADNKPGSHERALAVLEEARELRRVALGPDHIDYAYGCFNEGGLLIRHANTALIMADRQRADLATRGVDLVLEASAVAGRAGNDEEQLDFLDATLTLILKGGWPNRLASLAGCRDAIRKLSDAGARVEEDEEEPEEESEEEEVMAAEDTGPTPTAAAKDNVGQIEDRNLGHAAGQGIRCIEVS